MILCLVTDRRRLGAAIGVPDGGWRDALLEQVGAAAEAGVDYIQVREPDLESADLADLVREAMDRVRHTPARLLVNDRVDVALATGAHGVQLKEASFSPVDVRRIAPKGFLIGCSVHSAGAAAARNGADFLVAGTVAATASKPGVEHLDEVGLGTIVQAAGQPVLAIGGMTISSVPMLMRCRVSGLAAISAFFPSRGDDIVNGVKKRVAALQLALESAREAN